jgi:mono/diheme cytochrome c family protein
MKKSYSLLLALIVSTVSIQAQVDYDSEIQPIFTANCNSCHSSGQNGFNSSSYEAVMASTSNNYDTLYVFPGNADESPLVDKLGSSPQFGSQMPQGGSLSTAQIDLIKQWINEGANEVPTSNEVEFTDPTEFQLLGNYPNPFNPTTQIQFRVPVSTRYTIAIYTVHGRLISEQTGNVGAGLARVNVDMTRNPSGVYLYRVTAAVNSGNLLIGTGRMTLIK